MFEGPNSYLYGEETALLETIDGRYPFPRVAPPFRRGVREVVDRASDVDSRSNLPAHVEMAGPGTETEAQTKSDELPLFAPRSKVHGHCARQQ